MRFKKIHPWDLSPAQAVKLQNRLKTRIRLKKLVTLPKLVGGADVSFKKRRAVGAVVVLSLPEFKVIESVRKVSKIPYPYIPGLFTFREGPVLEKCFRALKNEPEVIIFDGQGLAHPRSMGLATHLGILLNKPTIGCAKSRLFGEYVEVPKRRGSFSYLKDKRGEKIGAVLRTKDNVKPLFVSPGYKIDLAGSIEIVLRCAMRYRLPEPLRLADQITRRNR